MKSRLLFMLMVDAIDDILLQVMITMINSNYANDNETIYHTTAAIRGGI